MAKRTDTTIQGAEATAEGGQDLTTHARVQGAAATAGTGQAQAVGAWLTKLPDDHFFYNLVGRVASEWSHFEHTLDLIIWELARWQTDGLTDQIPACITAQIMGVPGRCQAIESLCDFRGIPDKPILKAVRTLRQSSGVPADGRARVIHHAWYIEEPSKRPGAFRAMPKTDRRFGVHDYTKDEFDILLKHIGNLQKSANELKKQISDALHALQGTAI